MWSNGHVTEQNTILLVSCIKLIHVDVISNTMKVVANNTVV